MNDQFYIGKYNFTEDQWRYLHLIVGIEDILDDEPFMRAILRFCETAETQNPYYKFFEILFSIKDTDRITLWDLETLDDYYHRAVMESLANGLALQCFGLNANSKSKIKYALGIKKNNINYDCFRNLILAIV